MIRSCFLTPRQIFEPAVVKQTISSQFFLLLGWEVQQNTSWLAPRETLMVSGKQNSLFPAGPVIKCLRIDKMSCGIVTKLCHATDKHSHRPYRCRVLEEPMQLTYPKSGIQNNYSRSSPLAKFFSSKTCSTRLPFGDVLITVLRRSILKLIHDSDIPWPWISDLIGMDFFRISFLRLLPSFSFYCNINI